jgi:mxaJ protein
MTPAPPPRRSGLALALFAVAVTAAVAWLVVAPPRPARELRVCADPNNLPFSNEREEGFENRLAQLVAGEMHAAVRYTWWAQRRGFVRNTLRAGECDVIMGVPTTYELVLPTAPYYRSTYVFVSREDRGLDVRTFDDEALRTLRIGVHVIGDDYANPPPAHALASRGIVQNVVGYSIYGDYAQPDPPARLVQAVADGEVDLAIVWGPLAGYFARRDELPLRLVPVSPEVDLPFLPFVFDMSIGVRREDEALKEELDAILRRKAPEVEALLEEFGFPFVRRVRRTAHHQPGRAQG